MFHPRSIWPIIAIALITGLVLALLLPHGLTMLILAGIGVSLWLRSCRR